MIIRNLSRVDTVIGIDETNNGLDLPYTNPHHKPCLIIAGYIMQDPKRANYGTARYESKGKCRFFSRKRATNVFEVLEKAREYTQRYPDFLYLPISKGAIECESLIHIIRGKALATLVLEFFLKYKIDTKRTKVIFDDVSGEIPSERTKSVLEAYLDLAEVNISPDNITYRVNGDSKVVAIRKADMIGYYITAIRHLGNMQKWPYRRKKLSLDRLASSMIEILERKEPDYPEL